MSERCEEKKKKKKVKTRYRRGQRLGTLDIGTGRRSRANQIFIGEKKVGSCGKSHLREPQEQALSALPFPYVNKCYYCAMLDVFLYLSFENRCWVLWYTELTYKILRKIETLKSLKERYPHVPWSTLAALHSDAAVAATGLPTLRQTAHRSAGDGEAHRFA